MKSVLATFSDLRSVTPALAVATISMNVLGLALPLALLQVYDRIIPSSSTGTLVVLIFGVILAMVLENTLRVARTAVTSWMGARFEHLASCAAFDRLLLAPINKVESAGTGEQLERMSAISALKDFYAEQGLGVFLDLPFIVVFLGIVWLLGGVLVLVPVAALLAFALVMYYDGLKLRKAVSEYNVVRDRRLNFVIEALSGIHTIKSMSMESQMLQRYTRLQEAVANADRQVVLQNAWALTVSNLFSQGVMILVAAFGSLLVIDNRLTVGGLSACTLLAGRALQPVQRAVGMWTRLQSIRLHRERAEEIFHLELPPPPVHPLPTASVRGSLELRDVAFRYDPKLPDVFAKTSISIAAGECIGIVGTNGCGKSTLLGLMRGALTPTEGEVLLDGEPMTSYLQSALKKGVIAYLPHQVSLFRGSIIDNLTMFRPELRASAMELARDIGLDDVVAALPQGFDTPVADGAADAMPRGIRQRIAIVRALTYKPKILLFDEANTAVDGPGDERLRVYLESLKGTVTMILVTLRPSLLKLADRRFEISGNTLIVRQEQPWGGQKAAPPPPQPITVEATPVEPAAVPAAVPAAGAPVAAAPVASAPDSPASASPVPASTGPASTGAGSSGPAAPMPGSPVSGDPAQEAAVTAPVSPAPVSLAPASPAARPAIKSVVGQPSVSTLPAGHPPGHPPRRGMPPARPPVVEVTAIPPETSTAAEASASAPPAAGVSIESAPADAAAGPSSASQPGTGEKA